MPTINYFKLFAFSLGLILTSSAAVAQKVPESVMTAAAQGKAQRVIVFMAPASEGGRQEAFRAPERYIASTLGTDARLVRGLEDQPLVVAEIDRAGLVKLQSDKNVRRVLPDTLMTAFLPDSTKLLHVPELWSKNDMGSGVSVAILDTGVQLDHPFLASHIAAQACFSTNSSDNHSSSLCPNGQQEQIGPGASAACDYKAVTVNCVHGTHVAGIAAGTSGEYQGIKLNGMAPQAGIVAVQVFSKFEGEDVCGKDHKTCINAWTSDVIRGLLFVEKEAAHYKIAAVNLSLGGGKQDAACDTQSAYTDIVNRLTQEGVAVVAAAGNNGYVGAVSEPGCLSSVITVGAEKKDSTVDTSYSNVSPKIDVLAPGTQILSSAAGSYYKLDGTSMAAPHITGLFALLKAKHPEASVATLLAAIKNTGTPITDPRDHLAFPMPNAVAALAALDGGQAATPAPQPQPQPATPDPRLSSCGPVCVGQGQHARRVIFVLANHDPVAEATLSALHAVFGPDTKIEDLGDGKLAVELPEGTSDADTDRARKNIGDKTKVFPDTPLQTLQPGESLQIK